MSTAVILPALGESVVEGTIAQWLVKEGDRVERDQPLVEITTDKVDAEIPAPIAGRIERICVSEGEIVSIGAELARIDGHSERSERTVTTPATEPPAIRATPLAARVAEARGVPLDGITPAEPGGRITKLDVLRQASLATEAEPRTSAGSEPRPERTPQPPQPPQADRTSAAGYALQPGDRVIPMSPLRKLVAEHMVFSKQTSPHVGTVAEIDMGEVSRVRDLHKREFHSAHSFSLSFLPFVVHASVRALREFPALNASVVEAAIVEKADLHIGVAVETEKGLVVPVIRHADRLSLLGIAHAIEDLSSRARSKRLSADELRGGTFTVSNPGRHGNLYGFAIINQPQVGILRMGEIVKRPVVRTLSGEDVITVRPVMHLALSYDHRAVDGAPANGFLYRIRELLGEADFDL